MVRTACAPPPHGAGVRAPGGQGWHLGSSPASQRWRMTPNEAGPLTCGTTLCEPWWSLFLENGEAAVDATWIAM